MFGSKSNTLSDTSDYEYSAKDEFEAAQDMCTFEVEEIDDDFIC